MFFFRFSSPYNVRKKIRVKRLNANFILLKRIYNSPQSPPFYNFYLHPFHEINEGKFWRRINKQKRLYNRETIAALNYEIQQISLITPFLLYATQIINLIINSKSSTNHNKMKDFQPLCNPYKEDCISIVESLLNKLY